MKKKFLVPLFLIICLCGVWLIISVFSIGVFIDKEHSFLSDFYVEDGKVHIKCVLFIENSTDFDRTFMLNAQSPEDVTNGLLLPGKMHGINLETEDVFFVIAAGESRMFLVDFQGKYGGNPHKVNRLLPGILEIILISDDNTGSAPDDE